MDVLVDLDGTLLDPKPGILGSIQYALRCLGAPVPPIDDLAWAIGPPLRTTFPRLLGGAGRTEEAVALYRENYRNGAMYDAVVYTGIPQALEALTAAGCRLIVATAKPHFFARPILEHFDLARHFAAIYGPELDGTNDSKADLIAHIMRPRTRDVGCRHHDRRPPDGRGCRRPQRHAHGRRDLGLRQRRRADCRWRRRALRSPFRVWPHAALSLLGIARKFAQETASAGPIVASLKNCRFCHPM